MVHIQMLNRFLPALILTFDSVTEMKRLYKVLSILVLMAMGSCSDLLDTEPRQSLTPEVALSSLEGYQALAFTMYGRARSFDYYAQQMMLAPDIMADNLRIISNTGRYIGQEANADREHMGLWSELVYGGINDANIIIAQIDEVPGDTSFRNRIKGEAYFMRALFYFDLAKLYGYEPGKEVNGWNKSVIIRTTPTIGFSDADFRIRSTNEEVYELIESDLLQAISLLLPVGLGSENVFRASRGSAQALLARAYLYHSKFQEAEDMATQAMNTFGITNNGGGLLTPSNYVQGFSIAPNPESLFEIEIRAVDWDGVDGVNNSMSSLVADVSTSAQFIVTATEDLMADYESGDIRRATWTETTRLGAEGTVYRSNKWLGHKGDFLENIPVIRASELFLIRAEARYRTSNAVGARTDLNTLRAQRGLPQLNPTVSGEALFNRILTERRLEFALEGHRWFDLKRNGLEIPKTGSFEPVPYSDYRILAPIPQGQLLLNKELENNPGYN